MNFDKIREQVDIIDLISQYLTLKKTGLNFKGLCPFHNEKTPSFVVSPDKRIFHCFGCGKGGDVIKFVSEIEGINYFEAGLKLAKDYKIDIEIKNDDSFNDSYKIMELSAELYHENLLKNLKNEQVSSFLKNRKITDDIIEKFYLGYAPDQFNFLINNLKKKKIDLKLSEKIGLIKIKKDYYDAFRNRIIFPIRNLRGEFIAFGGRTLDNEIMPKYLNSPESIIFHKRKNLYGLFENRANIKQSDEVIVVEGYMDLISMYSYGITNCVATLGTAFTKEQLNLINRFVQNIVFLYDADKAGIKAAIKGAVTAVNQDLIPKLMLLPDNLDPDDFIKKFGKEEFLKLKNKNYDLIKFIKNLIFQQIDLKNIENQNRLIKRLKKIYSDIDNPVYKNHFIKGVGEILDINHNELKKYFSTIGSGYSKPTVKKEKFSDKITVEEQIIAFILNYRQYIEHIELEYIEDEFYKNLIQEFKKGSDIKTLLNTDQFPETRKERLRFLTLQEFTFDEHTEENKYFSELYFNLKKKYLKNKMKNLTQLIKTKEKNGNEEDLELLLKEKNRVVSELSKIKGG